MLKKQNRLLKFDKTKEAVTFTTQLFNLKISKSAGNTKKFGFIVSKKVSKSAVLRNKTKRVIRSVIEEDLGKIEGGRDILFISKKQLDWSQKQDVKEIIENTFKKARILQ